MQVGFRNEYDAESFRAKRPEYSMESTKNRRVCLVVLDGWSDGLDWIDKVKIVCKDLA